MGKCNIDHTKEDVKKKLDSQKEFLPERLYEQLEVHLNQELPQSELNEIFHLLKKYDLSTEEEQLSRNEKLASYVTETK